MLNSATPSLLQTISRFSSDSKRKKKKMFFIFFFVNLLLYRHFCFGPGPILITLFCVNASFYASILNEIASKCRKLR